MSESQTQTHINIINSNPHFLDIINNIIGDMLMGRVRFDEKKQQLSLHINNYILNLITNWYNMIAYLPPFELSVYRGVKNMCSKQKIILQPIPFSTSIDKNNAYEWININDNNSFIMKINVNKSTRFSVTGNYAEGNEVVLPAGYLKMVDITLKNKTKIVSYIFIPFTLEEMILNFKNLNFFFDK